MLSETKKVEKDLCLTYKVERVIKCGMFIITFVTRRELLISR